MAVNASRQRSLHALSGRLVSAPSFQVQGSSRGGSPACSAVRTGQTLGFIDQRIAELIDVRAEVEERVEAGRPLRPGQRALGAGGR